MPRDLHGEEAARHAAVARPYQREAAAPAGALKPRGITHLGDSGPGQAQRRGGNPSATNVSRITDILPIIEITKLDLVSIRVENEECAATELALEIDGALRPVIQRCECLCKLVDLLCARDKCEVQGAAGIMPRGTGFLEDEMAGFQVDIHLFIDARDDLKTEELMVKRNRAVKEAPTVTPTLYTSRACEEERP